MKGRRQGYASLNAIKGFGAMKVTPHVGVGKKVFKPEKETDDLDAVREGNFEYNFLPSSRIGLSVDWISHKKTYWDDDMEILKEIVDELKVRYPADHPDKPLQVIKGEDVNPDNYQDSFFTLMNNDMSFSRKLEGGTYLFDLSDPLDRLFYYSYSNNPNTLVKDGRTVSKYLIKKIKFELTLPEVERRKKLTDSSKDIDAITYLHPTKGLSTDKLKMIAKIMNVRDVDHTNVDPENLRMSLKLHAAINTSELSKYGSTVQDRFIKLCETPNEEIDIMYHLTKAFDYNIIIKRRDQYEINNEPIEGVNTEPQLVDYLLSKSHANELERILDEIQMREDQLTGKSSSK